MTKTACSDRMRDRQARSRHPSSGVRLCVVTVREWEWAGGCANRRARVGR